MNLENNKSKEGKIRLFAAVKIPYEISSRLTGMVDLIFRDNEKIKKVPPENIHLTIKFLGSHKKSDYEKIVEALSNAVKNISKFTFSIKESIKAFPSFSHAKIIYAYTGNGTENIKKLFDLVESNLETVGIEKEKKKFKSHITLARSKEEIDIKDYVCKNELKQFNNINCDFVTLFESVLSRNGPIYIARAEFKLK